MECSNDNINVEEESEEQEKEGLSFFSDFFGFNKDRRKRAESNEKKVGMFSRFKHSFAYYSPTVTFKTPPKANREEYEIRISQPTNFTHVTGTAKLNLISLEQAKQRERAYLDRS